MAISFHVKSDCSAGLAFQSEMVSGSRADQKPLRARSPSVVSEATAEEELSSLIRICGGSLLIQH